MRKITFCRNHCWRFLISESNTLDLEIVKIQRGDDEEWGYYKFHDEQKGFIRHRHEDDGPAVIAANGDIKYCWHGNFHRINGPACYNEYNKYEKWIQYGVVTRPDNLPAMVDQKGVTTRYMVNGELHCDNGPAMRFNYDNLDPEILKELKKKNDDKYFINGVQVTQQIVMNPETLDPHKDILKEDNLEVRYIMIERYSWVKFLKEVKAKIIERNKNDIENTEEMLCSFAEHTLFIGACPSTARVYALEVPEGTKTCKEAKDYLFSGDSSNIIGAT